MLNGRPKAATSRHPVMARSLTIAVGLVVLGGGAVLRLGQSQLSRSAVQAQRLAAQQGHLMSMTEQGATCQQMSFDNDTGAIVALEQGPCRASEPPGDALPGAIRGVLKGN
jgi:hypothetical protein